MPGFTLNAVAGAHFAWHFSWRCVQTATQSIPSFVRPAAEMRSGPHGGSHTR